MIKPRPALFKWRHFEPEIIVCAVRWYLRFSLSYRDVEELLMERGLPADHTTIWRWVQRYAPELNKRCRRELKPTNGSWSSPPAGHHSRRQPILPEGDRGAEAEAEAGTAMPLSNLPVSKQCCGTAPSRDQAASKCQPRFSIVRWSLGNDSRLRGSAHDLERPSEVVAERGCPWADSVHPGNPRIES